MPHARTRLTLRIQQHSRTQLQAIGRELYRRFGVSSYKLIRQSQYQAVLEFLDEWRQAEAPDADTP